MWRLFVKHRATNEITTRNRTIPDMILPIKADAETGPRLVDAPGAYGEGVVKESICWDSAIGGIPFGWRPR